MLKANDGLSRLSVMGNDISPIGTAALLEGFAHSASLKQLSLQSNDVAGDTLAELLQHHPGIVVGSDGSLWRT